MRRFLKNRHLQTVAARYYTTAGQSFPNGGVATNIQFNTKDFDTHNAVATGASWTFSAPRRGYYSIHVTVNMATTFSASDAYLYLVKGGVVVRRIKFETVGEDTARHFSDIIFLERGDPVLCQLSHNDGSGNEPAAVFDGGNVVSIALVGE